MVSLIKKALCACLTASLSMYALAGTEVEVNRAITTPIYEINTYDAEISFWREVCTKKDIQVEVSKTFVKLGSEHSYYRDNSVSTYFFEGSDKCYGEVFTVSVPNSLPNGVYEYRPKARINSKYPLLDLPTENISVKR